MTQISLFDPPPTKSYHNTVSLSHAEVAKLNAKANAQESEILQIFRRYQELTPWQCEARLNALGKKWPITSIRRAITNLTEQGFLLKTGYKITGPLGHKENTWKII
jgi:hypothetical protein